MKEGRPCALSAAAAAGRRAEGADLQVKAKQKKKGKEGGSPIY